MAFTRPTLSSIISRIDADIRVGLSIGTVLRRSFLGVLSKALSGASHTLHGHINWAVDQLFPDTADDEYLIRWATIWGINRNEATYAELNIEITGTTGGTVPAGTVFQRTDGTLYQVDTEVVAPAGGTVQALIVAEEPGADGNLSDGSIVSLTSPIAGVESDAEVLSTSIEADDQETIDDLRVRLLERIQSPPSGGTVSDYIAYAKTVTGVTRAWVFPGHLGEGTVGLSFVEDNEDPIIPDSVKVAEVQAAVDLLKPITADLYVFAPIATPINPTIKIRVNDSDTRAAVETELQDLISREAQVAGSWKSAGVVYDGIMPISKINEAISIAQGEEDHVLVSPTSDVEPLTGGLVTLGTITFQDLT